jgi:hypothetical protein
VLLEIETILNDQGGWLKWMKKIADEDIGCCG